MKVTFSKQHSPGVQYRHSVHSAPSGYSRTWPLFFSLLFTFTTYIVYTCSPTARHVVRKLGIVGTVLHTRVHTHHQVDYAVESVESGTLTIASTRTHVPVSPRVTIRSNVTVLYHVQSTLAKQPLHHPSPRRAPRVLPPQPPRRHRQWKGLFRGAKQATDVRALLAL